MYGLAADIKPKDFNNDGKLDIKDWVFVKQVVKNLGACFEPVELTPRHMHIDWRGTCQNGW